MRRSAVSTARADRARAVRRMSRVVLLVGVVVAFLAPVSWERLPDFKAVVVPGSGPKPPGKPGPGIDPTKQPDRPKIISPRQKLPRSISTEYAYFDQFRARHPYVSTCDPVPFKIRTKAAPANGDELIFDALQRLADATGLSFEFVGYTTDVYKFNDRRIRFSWEDRRKPLWIGWATGDEVPDLGPKSDTEAYAVGVGGPVSTQHGNGQWEIIGGGVVLRAGERLPNRFGPGSNTGNVLLHELGHAMGLDHVDAKAEQMYPETTGQAPDGYGDGDVAGLQGLTTGCSS